jgi:hypothetical protein
LIFIVPLPSELYSSDSDVLAQAHFKAFDTPAQPTESSSNPILVDLVDPTVLGEPASLVELLEEDNDRHACQGKPHTDVCCECLVHDGEHNEGCEPNAHGSQQPWAGDHASAHFTLLLSAALASLPSQAVEAMLKAFDAASQSADLGRSLAGQ